MRESASSIQSTASRGSRVSFADGAQNVAPPGQGAAQDAPSAPSLDHSAPHVFHPMGKSQIHTTADHKFNQMMARGQSTEEEMLQRQRFSFSTGGGGPEAPPNVGGSLKPQPLSGCGISTVVGCLDTGRPQVLTYDLRLLTNLGGILNMFSRGTIFRDNYGLRVYFVVHFASLLVCVALVMVSVGDFATFKTDTVETLAKYLNFTVPVVLGLYISISLERWWVLRVDAIGNLCNCAHDITQQIGCYLPEDESVTARVRRWSMASVSLVMLAAREQSDLGLMLRTGQLEESEALSLENVSLYGRPMVMWAWISRLTNESMSFCTGPEPHSNQVYLMLEICIRARNSVQTIHTYLRTALPFAYVHMVALLVDAMVCIITVKCSCVCMKAYHEEPKNFQRIGYEMVAFVALPLLYHGLMSVTIEIQDPFGDDMADFPFSWYQHWHQEHLDAAMFGWQRFPWLEWELLSGHPQSPEARLLASGGIVEPEDVNEEQIEVERASKVAADGAAGKIMKDATIEVVVHVKRALKGFTDELKDLQQQVERAGELRAKDSERLLQKLASAKQNRSMTASA